MRISKLSHAAIRLKDDPLGFFLDLLVLVIANLLIPIPLAGTILLEFRGFAIGALGFIAILVLFVFLSVGVVFAAPILIASGYLENIFHSANSNISADESFTDTQTPQQNPFGGSGLSYITVTAYFHDPSYYLTFGKVHTGIDIVPNDTYYQSNKTYKSGGKVIIFATLSGRARFYTDEEGGKTVEITNNDQTTKALFIHFSDVFVTGGDVKAGIPLGVMGNSGFATADHLHYEIRVKNGDNWIAVDPLSYIH